MLTYCVDKESSRTKLEGATNGKKNEDDDKATVPLQNMTIDDIRNASEKLREAIRNLEIRKIRRYLRRYANDLNRVCTSTDSEGWSVMTSTADSGAVDIMTMLIQAAVPVHWPDANGWMPLHCAAHRGHEAMIRCLIGAPNLNIDYKSKHGWTALHIAVRKVFTGIQMRDKSCLIE